MVLNLSSFLFTTPVQLEWTAFGSHDHKSGGAWGRSSSQLLPVCRYDGAQSSTSNNRSGKGRRSSQSLDSLPDYLHIVLFLEYCSDSKFDTVAPCLPVNTDSFGISPGTFWISNNYQRTKSPRLSPRCLALPPLTQRIYTTVQNLGKQDTIRTTLSYEFLCRCITCNNRSAELVDSLRGLWSSGQLATLRCCARRLLIILQVLDSCRSLTSSLTFPVVSPTVDTTNMADNLVLRGGSILRRVSFGISPSTAYHRPFFDEMSTPIPTSKSDSAVDSLSPDLTRVPTATSTTSSTGDDGRSLEPTSSGSPRLSRNPSFTNSSSYQEDWEVLTPLDKLTVFDLLDNFALPQRIEKWQRTVSAQTEKVRKSRDVCDPRMSAEGCTDAISKGTEDS